MSYEKDDAPLLGGENDFRLLSHGNVIPSEYYADQPYIVKTDDGGWLCCLTTGAGAEGASGQHVVTMKSFDEGKTWSKPVPVEPDGSPENSYAVMAKAQSEIVDIVAAAAEKLVLQSTSEAYEQFLTAAEERSSDE